MPPNVLVVMSDEHNPHVLGSDAAVETPTLDDLAANAATFGNAYCPVPLCAPSRQCTLTGLTQDRAGAWGNSSPIDPERQTLPASLADAGYETCLVGKMHFNGPRQFNGFEHRPYGDLTGHGIQQPGHQPDPIDPERLDVQPRRQGIEIGTRIPGAGVTEIPESLLQEQVVAREAIAWLREHRRDEPWFLTASFSRPHFPLTAPRRHVERYLDDVPAPPVDRASGHDHPFVEDRIEHYDLDARDDEELRRARACYFACVAYLDEVLSEFLGTLEREGFLEDTVVVYTSDHGDMAGEHGLFWKSTYHEASAGIPLMVQTPAHRSGERDPAEIGTPVSLLDLYPTLCSLAGADAPGDLDGADLSASVRTGEEPERGPVITDYLSAGDLSYRMVREGAYKYVAFRDAPELLFDLGADPLERENLAPGATGADAEALERLRDVVADSLDWATLDERRRRDRQRAGEDDLPIPPGTGNAYLMPDGRLIDAASPLYTPDELAADPSRVFEDYPD